MLAVFFVLTGFAGLLAEQCFEKLLVSLVGASTPAAAIVLSVYFLGLTLGAFLYPKIRRAAWIPFRTYGLLEGGIGLWALFLAVGHSSLLGALTPILRMGVDHHIVLQILRFLVACGWILPPTLLMGATFPAVVDALEAIRVPSPRKTMSLFYTLNLAGAILGAFVGPYLFFPHLGLVGTLLLTCMIDFTVVVGVLIVMGCHPKTLTRPAINYMEEGYGNFKDKRSFILVFIGFFSGFLFFALEVLWTHLIGAVLGNSVYAFAAMLSLVLVGLFVGGLLASILFKEKRPISPLTVSIMLIFGSLVLAWQKGQWDHVPILFMVWGQGLTEFTQGEILRWVQAARLLVPPSILFGMVYPSLFRMDVFPQHNRARMMGLVSAANSIGCVLGALLCGFLLIPGLGSESTSVLLGVSSLLAGLGLAAVYGAGWSRRMVVGLCVLVLLIWASGERWNLLHLTSGGHVYFGPGHVQANTKLHSFHEDTLGGITTVVSTPPTPRKDGLAPPPIKTLLTNGKFQANDAGEVFAQTGVALIPILYTPRQESALVIGLGSGHSAEVVREMGFNKIDIAEISPGIVEAARRHFPHVNGGILEKPSTRLFMEDGRNVLLLRQHSYDLITMEISSVWFAGSTSLYCQEFYELAKNRLNRGGVLQQWIQIHHIGTEELGSVVASMHAVFPYVSFWVFGGQGILLGSMEPQVLQGVAIKRFLDKDLFKGAEGDVITALSRVLASRLLTSEDINRMLTRLSFIINTDANRYLEYATPKYNLDKSPLERANLLAFSRFATFPRYVSPVGISGEAESAILGIDSTAQRTVLNLPIPKNSGAGIR